MYRLRVAVFVVEQDCVFQDVDGADPRCWHLLGCDAGGRARRLLPPAARGHEVRRAFHRPRDHRAFGAANRHGARADGEAMKRAAALWPGSRCASGRRRTWSASTMASVSRSLGAVRRGRHPPHRDASQGESLDGWQLKGKVAVITGSTSGIGRAIAEAFAREGAGVMLNGFGEKAAIESLRAGLEKDRGVRADYDAADMTQPAEIAAMIERSGRRARRRRHPREQRRHPARGADGRVSRRTSGTRSSRSTCPRHSMRPSTRCRCMKKQALGTHHQHRLRARAGRLAEQVGLHRLQARHQRLHQGGRRGDRRARRSREFDLPGLRAHAARARSRSSTAPARTTSRANRRSATCILAPQPTKEFVTVSRSRGTAVFLCSPRRGPDHRRAASPWTAAGRRADASAPQPRTQAGDRPRIPRQVAQSRGAQARVPRRLRPRRQPRGKRRARPEAPWCPRS